MLGDVYAHPSVYMGWMGARAVCLLLKKWVDGGGGGDLQELCAYC